MRVLFTAIAGIDHLYPLVPLAQAFTAAGHDVLVTTAGVSAEAASATGLHVIDVAPGYDPRTVIGQAMSEHPEFAATVWPRPVGAELTPWAPMFAAVNRPLIERTIELADRWRPGLVVHEQVATVGLIAAAVLGVPSVQHNPELPRTGQVHAAAAGLLADVCARFGVTALGPPGHTLETFPPSMLAGNPEGWFFRQAVPGGGVLGEELPVRSGRPRIAITTGNCRDHYRPEMIAPVLTAAKAVDAEFVLALRDLDTTRLPRLPPNVRSAGWLPHGALFGVCSAVVHNGSPGSVLAAADAGVPQLLVLNPEDQTTPITGDAVRNRGIGLVAGGSEPDESVFDRLLTDETLRQAAAEVRAERAALPSPAEIVVRLGDLSNGRKP